MTLTFPCRPANRGIAPPPGTPTRAAHCQCGTHLTDTEDNTCIRCGRHAITTINTTWATRAAAVKAAA